MHKKIESELMSLAHRILQMKNKEDLNALTDKAREVYERLTLLQLIDRFAELPTTSLSLEELQDEFDYENLKNALKDNSDEVVQELAVQETPLEEPQEASEDSEVVIDLFSEMPDKEISETAESDKDLFEGIEELQGAIDLDVATNLLEGNEAELVLEQKDQVVNQTIDIVEPQQPSVGKSLNDVLFQKQLQVGLNDRIAFVKNLFDGSQEEFNRVISQLNSFSSHQEALEFINKMVKPDYNWKDQEELELRLLQLIERKFS